MTDDGPRFARWFQRWWIALVGGLLVIGGAVIYEAAAWSVPRGIAHYSSSTASSDWTVAFFASPEFLLLTRFGEVLVAVGLVAVVATVVVRLALRRRQA